MSRIVKIFWRTFFIGFILFVLFLLGCNFGVFGTMPSIDDIQNPTAKLSSQVYAQDGSLMGKYYLEDRINVDYKDINTNIINALVATEDERFQKHSGIDLRAIGRAVRGLGKDGGASTITMQTAKNLFTENWGTRNAFVRAIQKVKEAIIAVKLEKNFTKEEIIALYLNSVEYSDHVYGIRNASKTFFQKEPDRVNAEEAAMLVGMVNAPSLYNPRKNPKNALERRNLVIDQMKKNGYISVEKSDSLKRLSIDLSRYKKLDETTGIAPYFRMTLGEDLKKWCEGHKKLNGDKYNVYKDGLKIYTTINPKMQIYAEEAVAKHMSSLQKVLSNQWNVRDKSVWKGHENVIEAAIKQSQRWTDCKAQGLSDSEARKTFNQKAPMKIFSWNAKRERDTMMTPVDSIMYCRAIMQASLMAIDPATGQVRAWVGGVDFKNFKYDHVKAERQVGSTIKPLLYGLAIEHSGLTPNSYVQDQQQHFKGWGDVPNTGKTCTGGSMTMAEALAKSRNCATAYILKQLDYTGNNSAKMFVDFLNNKCGITKKLSPVPSICLGTVEISMFELMQAYTMLPGKGFNAKPYFIDRIEDRNGNVLENFSPKRTEVFSEQTAYHVVDMMQGVVDHGTAHNLKSSYKISGEVAGKTGTTQSNTDAWFMGYTPQILAGAWVGCDDQFIRIENGYLGQGSKAAMPIWAYFYEKISNDPTMIGIDNTVKFEKPEAGNNSTFTDGGMGIRNFGGAEYDEVSGNGTESQYIENTHEFIGGESQVPVDDKVEPKEEKPKETPAPIKPISKVNKDAENNNPYSDDDNGDKKDKPKQDANINKKPKALMGKKTK